MRRRREIRIFRAPKLPGRQRRLFEDPGYAAYKAERRRLEALGVVTRPEGRDRSAVRRFESLGMLARGEALTRAASLMNADRHDAGLRGPWFVYLEAALDDMGVEP